MESRRFVIAVHRENCTGCLICQLRCSFNYAGEFNPSKAWIQINRVDHENEISFTDECNSCGICARACPYGALEIESGA